MHALQRLGLAAAVSDAELREFCPYQWRDEEEVGADSATVWTPGQAGHPTLAQVRRYPRLLVGHNVLEPAQYWTGGHVGVCNSFSLFKADPPVC